MKKRIFATFLSLVCAFSLLSMPIGSSNRATLFINDSEWEDDSLLPFIEANGKMLIPALAFANLNGMRISESDALGSLLIEKEDAFLSFNLNFGTCLDEKGTESTYDIYRYGGEIYLEPHMICEKFGITFETEYAPDGYLAARISDGSQAIPFTELLISYSDDGLADIPYLYNPKGKTVAGSFMHPILLVPAASNIRAAIEGLGNHSASFALSPKDVSNYINVLPNIYANGHTVVYYMDFTSDTDVDKFREEMEAANKIMLSVVGKTSRIYVSAAAYEDIPQIDSYAAKSCTMHLVLDDLKSSKMINIALSESPSQGIFNFSLASDEQTRKHYAYFFEQFDKNPALRSMSLTESSSVR